jgi:hypothetical protein
VYRGRRCPGLGTRKTWWGKPRPGPNLYEAFRDALYFLAEKRRESVTETSLEVNVSRDCGRDKSLLVVVKRTVFPRRKPIQAQSESVSRNKLTLSCPCGEKRLLRDWLMRVPRNNAAKEDKTRTDDGKIQWVFIYEQGPLRMLSSRSCGIKSHTTV